MLHDRDQPVLRMTGLHPWQRLKCAAHRSQGILQFVRDIGGEALDGVEAIVKRLGHFSEGAGKMADLVRTAK